MNLRERIAVIIDVAKDNAVKGLNQTGTSIGGVAKQSKGAQLALGFLNRTGLQSTAMGQRLTQSITQTGSVMGGLKQSGIGVGQVLGTAVAGGAVAAGAALASFAAKGIDKFESATAEVRKLKNVIGGTAEDASKLRFVGQSLGIETDKLVRGFGLMAKSVGLNKSTLNEYGVEIAKNTDGTTNFSETLLNVAHAYQATDDPAAKAAIRFAAFGKSGNDLIPILSKSDDELREFYKTADQDHQIFSDDDLESGRALSASTRQLNLAVAGLQIELAKGLVPALTEATEGITDVIHATDDALNPVGGLAKAFGYLVDTVTGPVIHGFKTFSELFQGHFVNSVKEAVHAIPAVGPAINSLTGWLDTGSDASDRAAKAEEKRAQRVQASTDKVNAAKDAQLAYAQALQSGVDGVLAYQDSLIALQDSTDDYNVALHESIQAGGNNTEKNKALEDATRALQHQIQDTAKASSAYAIQALGPTATKTEQAKAGNDAYRKSLQTAANSEIPGVRNQALVLIATLDNLGRQAPRPRVDIDDETALFKIRRLRTEWDALAGAMGPVGTQVPRGFKP